MAAGPASEVAELSSTMDAQDLWEVVSGRAAVERGPAALWPAVVGVVVVEELGLELGRVGLGGRGSEG